MRFKAFCISPHPGEIEVKPLVLCKECKHYTEHTEHPRAWVCDLTEWVHGGDWFCADGEKGEDDG